MSQVRNQFVRQMARKILAESKVKTPPVDLLLILSTHGIGYEEVEDFPDTVDALIVEEAQEFMQPLMHGNTCIAGDSRSRTSWVTISCTGMECPKKRSRSTIHPRTTWVRSQKALQKLRRICLPASCSFPWKC